MVLRIVTTSGRDLATNVLDIIFDFYKDVTKYNLLSLPDLCKKVFLIRVKIQNKSEK